MGNRTKLYIVCAFLFPLAFAAFVVGFGCPVWLGSSETNSGLWQTCETVFKNCSTLDFNDGGEWMIGVRAVEIFALIMFLAAAVDIVYENCCTNFQGRPRADRLASGVTCILGGLGGMTGVIVYVVKIEDLPSSYSYGWAFALLVAGSALALILGVGFSVSGLCLENKRRKDLPKSQINGLAPHLTTNNENYELTASSSKNVYDGRGGRLQQPSADNLPGFAIYNGLLNANGPTSQRNSLPPGLTATSTLPAPNLNGRGLPAIQPKSSQYYSLSDDRLLDPSFDLSEGFSYQPSRGRPLARGQDNPAFIRDSFYGRGVRADDPYRRGIRAEDPYSRGVRAEDPYSRGVRAEDPYKRGVRAEDPYSRGGREEDPYNRVNRAPRAGYNDPYGFDRQLGGRGAGSGVEDLYDRANYGRPNGQPMKDSFYNKPGRF